MSSRRTPRSTSSSAQSSQPLTSRNNDQPPSKTVPSPSPSSSRPSSAAPEWFTHGARQPPNQACGDMSKGIRGRRRYLVVIYWCFSAKTFERDKPGTPAEAPKALHGLSTLPEGPDDAANGHLWTASHSFSLFVLRRLAPCLLLPLQFGSTAPKQSFFRHLSDRIMIFFVSRQRCLRLVVHITHKVGLSKKKNGQQSICDQLGESIILQPDFTSPFAGAGRQVLFLFEAIGAITLHTVQWRLASSLVNLRVTGFFFVRDRVSVAWLKT